MQSWEWNSRSAAVAETCSVRALLCKYAPRPTSYIHVPYLRHQRYVRSPLGYFRRWIQGTLRVRTTLSITFRLGHVCLSCVKGMWATPFWSRFDLYASKKPCRLLQGPPFGLHSGPLPNISRTPILSSVCMPRCGCLPGSI